MVRTVIGVVVALAGALFVFLQALPDESGRSWSEVHYFARDTSDSFQMTDMIVGEDDVYAAGLTLLVEGFPYPDSSIVVKSINGFEYITSMDSYGNAHPEFVDLNDSTITLLWGDRYRHAKVANDDYYDGPTNCFIIDIVNVKNHNNKVSRSCFEKYIYNKINIVRPSVGHNMSNTNSHFVVNHLSIADSISGQSVLHYNSNVVDSIPFSLPGQFHSIMIEDETNTLYASFVTWPVSHLGIRGETIPDSIRQRYPNSDRVLYVRKSVDSGVTWGPLRNVRHAGKDKIQGTQVIGDKIGRIHVLWEETKSNDLFELNIYHSYSIDKGITWSPRAKLLQEDTTIANFEAVVDSDNDLHVAAWVGEPSDPKQQGTVYAQWKDGNWSPIEWILPEWIPFYPQLAVGPDGRVYLGMTVTNPELPISVPAYIYK